MKETNISTAMDVEVDPVRHVRRLEPFELILLHLEPLGTEEEVCTVLPPPLPAKLLQHAILLEMLDEDLRSLAQTIFRDDDLLRPDPRRDRDSRGIWNLSIGKGVEGGETDD